MKIGNKLLYLTQAATAYVIGLFLWEMYTNGAHKVEANPVTVYLSILAAYAADKEIGRWASRSDSTQLAPPRKGSWLVVFWVALYGMAYAAHSFNAEVQVPEGLARVVLWVVGIFFGTGSSKRLFALLQPEGTHWEAASSPAAATAVEHPKSFAKSSDQDRQDILNYLQIRPQGASSVEIGEALGIHSRTALRQLKAMELKKEVRSEGTYRNRVYKKVN